MFRYIAIEWDCENHPAADVADRILCRVRDRFREWYVGFDASGLQVSYTEPSGIASATQLGDGNGVILGALFKRSETTEQSTSSQLSTLDHDASTLIVRSNGRELIASYWGAYVAFLQCKQARKKWILRSPACVRPCLWTNVSGVNVFFSRMEDCIALDLRQYSINWKFVGSLVSCIQPQSGETGLNEVQEVHLGECVERRGERTSRSMYWNPCAIAGTDVIDDPLEAAAALRQTARACIFSWAARGNRFLHTLSGGIDSSIVLSCLSVAPSRPTVTCIHHYSTGAGDDERPFARLAAQQTGCELVEVRRPPSTSLQGILHTPRTARPAVSFPRLQRDRVEIELAKQRGAEAIFSGNLGDVLFHLSPGSSGAEEYLRRHGLRSEFFKVALNAALLDRISFWKVIRRAFANSWASIRQPIWIDPVYRGRKHRGMTRRIAEEFAHDSQLAPYVHPWLRSARGVPRGKLHMISPLTFDYYYDVVAAPGEPERPVALFSEPLVELCLRIPTYLHTRNAWDRAVARAAFRDDLPPQVARRTSKGTGDIWVRELLACNGDFLRELLLDGMLVKERILDRNQLEDAMPGISSRSGLAVSDLIEHLCTEVWARTWSPTRAQNALA